jgi:hypothetical protein
LTLLGTAPSLGKYSLISGNNINGAYSSYSGVGALRYTAADVQLWVMPSDSVVQRQVDTVSTTLGSMNALATSSMTGALGSDCASSSEGGCISVNYGATKVGGGDLNSAGITLVKSVNPNWRVGVFTNQQLNDATTPTTRYSSSRPAVGAMLGWSDSADNIGLGATVSVIGGSGDYTLGSDKTGVSSKAAQAKLTYSRPIDLDTTVTPYVGIRRSEFTVDGYITGDQLFPLTYSTVKQTSTDLLAGATVAHRISDNVLGTVNAGVVQNLARDLGTVNSTSDMGSHSAAIQGGSRISAALGAGISYAVDKNQRISFSTGWQQRGLTNAAVNSYGIGYTAGF